MKRPPLPPLLMTSPLGTGVPVSPLGGMPRQGGRHEPVRQSAGRDRGFAIAPVSGPRAAVAAVLAMALMVVALWAWGAAPRWVSELSVAGRSWSWPAADPRAVLWSLRLGAVAAASAAQALFLSYVVRALYRRDPFFDMLGLAAGLLGAVATVLAVTLAVTGA